MEQATNLFTKGLQMDSHPMVQGNDTLTDCLNGTLITMNGNEVILLNDMGNRRVDKAFLPPGYEPVGMKEYGGIIYVAAYNPITNKSLIGSFPSPLKKLSSSTSSGEELSGIFDFDNFTEGNYNVETDSVLNISVLKSDSFILPLTKDLSLRAGDKFAIYALGLSSLENYLTNYNNIRGNKVESPKNRKYTILAGILNSLNEFVDITKTLCRWHINNNKWEPINYDSEVSEIYKFNDGYFISDTFDNSAYNETIADANLIKERQKIAANTYSYKLVGPLYLKISLNHIERFNYNIYGTYDNGAATLWIEGFITYNCPDLGSGGSSVINPNGDYYTFDEKIPNNNFGFDLIGKNYVNSTSSLSIYNPNNNMYSTKVVRKYTNITSNRSGTTIFDYVIGVKADVSTPNIYLRGLSVKGSIDLSLLGSGTVKFESWRFYNNVAKRSTILSFAFNAYPEYGKTFGNLCFKFHDTLDGSDTTKDIIYPKVGYLPLYNGKQTIEIDWDEYGFKPLRTYTITTTYDSLVDGQIDTSYTVSESSTRWFLTTELFNDFYQLSAGIDDYCNANRNTEAGLKFYNKMKVSLTSSTTIKNESSKDKEVFEGSLIRFGSNQIDYSCKHNWNVVVTANPSLEVKNKELYPTYVNVKSSKRNAVEVNTVGITLIGSNYNPVLDSINAQNVKNYSTVLRNQLQTKQGKNLTTTGENNPQTAINSKNILETKLLVVNNSIQGYIQYYDVFKSKGDTVDTISNVFDDFSEILNANDVLPSASKYGGIFCNYDDVTGGEAQHYIDIAVGQTADNISLLEDSQRHDGLSNLASKSSHNREQFNVSSVVNLAYQYFNDSCGSVTFLYLFANDNRFPARAGLETGLSGAQYTRVWWKMQNGEWAVFPNLYLKGTELRDFILRALNNKTLVYCMYDIVTNGSVYAPKDDYIYYDSYSIPLVCNIKYRLTSGETITSVLNLGNSCGNLSFTPSSGSLSIDDDTVTFLLDSSETFVDNINKFDASSVSNVYIKGGLTHDSLGRPLNPGHVYSYEGGKLVRLNNNVFYVDTENKANDKNRLLYNIVTKGTVNSKFQAAGRDERETHTILIYDSVNVVNTI